MPPRMWLSQSSSYPPHSEENTTGVELLVYAAPQPESSPPAPSPEPDYETVLTNNNNSGGASRNGILSLRRTAASGPCFAQIITVLTQLRIFGGASSWGKWCLPDVEPTLHMICDQGFDTQAEDEPSTIVVPPLLLFPWYSIMSSSIAGSL
ncbi:hypothetical protein B0H19DRAFT_1066790 [Mycena capillaripes]|nr:hypothetical protein B0H19DRAFT_1066790 [Mycena capillaripes]